MNINNRKSVPRLRIVRSVSRISLSKIREMSAGTFEKSARTSFAVTRASLFSTLRENRVKKSGFVNPLMASKVMKTFILPILKEKIQADNENLRRAGKTGKKVVNRVVTNTLSLMLKRKVAETILELKRVTKKLESTLKENEKIKREIETYKTEAEKKEITHILISDFYNYNHISQREPERYSNKLAVKTLEYKVAFNIVLSKNHSLQEKLSKEHSNNTDLKTSKTKHKLSLTCANQDYIIIGDHLHSTYHTSLFLKRPLDILSALQTAINKTGIQKIKTHSSIILSQSNYLQEWESITNTIFEKHKKYFDIRKKAKILKSNVLTKVNTMIHQLLQATADSAVLQQEFDKQSKALEVLKIEFALTNEKVMEKQGKNSGNTDFICKFCFESYKEIDNLNWSCSRHTSEWSGEMYWCCGKQIKSAPGCSKSKHVPDTQEEEKFDEVLEKDQKNEICSTCKQSGHKFTECDKDPNFKLMTVKSLSRMSVRSGSVKLRRTRSRPFEEIEKLRINLTLNPKK